MLIRGRRETLAHAIESIPFRDVRSSCTCPWASLKARPRLLNPSLSGMISFFGCLEAQPRRLPVLLGVGDGEGVETGVVSGWIVS